MHPYLLIAAIAILWATFAVWIIRKYWRRSDDPVRGRQYAFAKLSAVCGGVGMAIAGPELLELPGVSPVAIGLEMLLFGFPGFLCIGYWTAVLIDAVAERR